MMKQEIQLMSAPVINPKAEATYKLLKEYNQVSLLLLMNILRQSKVPQALNDISKKDDWHILVAIRDEMRKGQPFNSKLPSKNATAIIFSFTDRRAEVCQLLQKLSHQSRAYCIQQGGLTGFLVPNPAYFKHLGQKSRAVVRSLEQERYHGKLQKGKSTKFG